jgi:hypothetical protein
MSSKKKHPPHETWEALERASLADEAARVATLSDAGLDAELAEHGLDPNALRAKGAALAESLGKPRDDVLEGSAWVTPPPPATPRRPGSRRPVLLLAAAIALFGLIGGAVALALWSKDNPPPKDLPDAMPSATAPPAPVPVPEEPREDPRKHKDKPRPNQ